MQQINLAVTASSVKKTLWYSKIRCKDTLLGFNCRGRKRFVNVIVQHNIRYPINNSEKLKMFVSE